MLPILKKKSEKAKAALGPAWHTNFRNYAVLPDTKLVRTSFFAAFGCVTLAAAAVIAVVYQEYDLHLLKAELVDTQTQIASMRGPSGKAVAQYKMFQAEEVKVNEVDAFLKSQKLVLSDLLIHLSKTLPPGVSLASVEYRETGASVRGYVQGASEQAAVSASEYERQLKEDEQFKKMFGSIALINLVRDQQSNKHMFEIVLSFGTKPRK